MRQSNEEATGKEIATGVDFDELTSIAVLIAMKICCGMRSKRRIKTLHTFMNKIFVSCICRILRGKTAHFSCALREGDLFREKELPDCFPFGTAIVQIVGNTYGSISV